VLSILSSPSPTRPSEPRRHSVPKVDSMTRSIAFALIAYGVAIAALSVCIRVLAPDIAWPILIAGVAGGALCAFWGIFALSKTVGKAKPLLTLMPIAFVFLSQAVTAWLGDEGTSKQTLPALLLTAGLGASMGMIMWIAYTDAGTTSTFTANQTQPRTTARR